jgi:indole-3-glycerol phosphate synthase
MNNMTSNTMKSETILHTIVADADPALRTQMNEVPVSELLSMPGFSRDIVSFDDALRGSPVSVIAEIKRQSPSKGMLRESFDVRNLAVGYETSGAAAISVLTEGNYFGGTLDNLAVAREAVSIPVLRKDFIVEPYQLFEARAYGADAALLIATLLDRSQIAELLHAAREVGITCLIELYEASELDLIDFDQVTILGVNNRDLRTFEVDTSRAGDILAQTPQNIVRVAESGLSNGSELAALTRLEIDAALIGETFILQDDPGDALSRILGEMNDLLAESGNHES